MRRAPGRSQLVPSDPLDGNAYTTQWTFVFGIETHAPRQLEVSVNAPMVRVPSQCLHHMLGHNRPCTTNSSHRGVGALHPGAPLRRQLKLQNGSRRDDVASFYPHRNKQRTRSRLQPRTVASQEYVFSNKDLMHGRAECTKPCLPTRRSITPTITRCCSKTWIVAWSNCLRLSGETPTQ